MATSQSRPQARPARRPQGDRLRTRPAKLLRVAGLPAVTALFAKAPHRVERLFFDQRMRAQVGDFCAELARAHKPYRLVPSEELERIAGSVMHGGIVALAQPQPVPILDFAKPADMAADKVAGWARGGAPLLMLDGIGNPHNLGAIVRTAAFFALPRIVLSDHPAQASPSDASYRVAEGGLEYVELHRSVRFASMLQQLRRSYRVIGTAAGNGQPIETFRRSERPLAVVLGNEEHGLPPATLAACEAVVTIPGSGLIQSLNVAASAAILLHALTRRV